MLSERLSPPPPLWGKIFLTKKWCISFRWTENNNAKCSLDVITLLSWLMLKYKFNILDLAWKKNLSKNSTSLHAVLLKHALSHPTSQQHILLEHPGANFWPFFADTLGPWDRKLVPSMPITTTRKPSFLSIPGIPIYCKPSFASWHPEKNPNWYQKGWRFAPCLAVFFFQAPTFFFDGRWLAWYLYPGLLSHFRSEKIHQMSCDENHSCIE